MVSENDSTRYQATNGMKDKLPSTDLTLHLDRDTLSWSMNRTYTLKSNLAVLDIIKSNFPDRTIAWASSCGPSARLGLGKYLKRRGMIYELTTEVGSNDVDVDEPTFNYRYYTEDCLLGSFSKNERIYDEDAVRMAWSYRKEMLVTAKSLLMAGDSATAVSMMDHSLESIPFEINPIDEIGADMAGVYLTAGDSEKGNDLLHNLLGQKLDQLEVITSMESKIQAVVPNELEHLLSVVESLFLKVKEHSLLDSFEEEESRFKEIGEVFLAS